MDNFTAAWAEYRRRRLAFVIPLVTILCMFAVIPILPTSNYFAQFWWLVVPFVMIWLIIAQIRFARWRCPRCGKLFLMRNALVGNVFARRCLHCGLAKSDVRSAGVAGA